MARGGYDVSITITTQWREGGKPPSPQKIERIKKPIRDLNTEIRKQQGLLSKLYNNWKSTFAVFAAGYATVVLFLSVMRALKNEFLLGFKAIEEYRQSVISLSATTMMFIKTTGDLSKDWEAAVGYAKQLAQKAEELDVIFTGTAKELLLAARALTTMGIEIDTSNKKQLQSWVALAEAAKAVTTGANKEFQIRQEIQALLEGQTRQGATLARILDRQLRTVEGYKGGLKEALEIWKAKGTVLEELSKRLQGFKQAQKDIRDLISTQWATLSTINRRVLRQGFLPAYHEINELLKKQVDYYTDTEHGLDRQRDLANRIALTWIKVNAALKVGYFLLTATIDLVDKFWFKEGRWQRIKEKATEFAGGLAIIFMKMLGKSEEEIIKFVEDTEAALGRMPKTTQGATKEHLSYIEQLVSDAKKFWTDLYDTYVKLGVAAYQRDLANLQNTEKERIELIKRKQQKQEEGIKKEISNIQKIRDVYNALLMDYERYESQKKEISQEMATEKLRIEAKLTGSLEDQYKYRMKQVEEWETQKWNRVLSINSAMWRKITSEENKIRAQAAKEGRTTIEQLYLDELYKLDELAGMKIQILKSTAEKEIEIRKTVAEKQKEIYDDIYTHTIDLAQTFQNTISDAFEGIVLGTRKLSDVFKAMRDALVREFATGLAGMITKKIEWENTLIGNLKVRLPQAFKDPLEAIKKIWSSAMNWLKGSTGKLLGALGTVAYGIAGIAGSEPWRAIGGAGATAALFTGHPVIAMATITAAEIGRAIFKGRVEWVGVGAGAAGIPSTQIGLRRGMGFWGQQVLAGIGGATGGAAASMLGLGMIAGGVLGAAVGGLITLFTSMFSRKWPTIRGTAEVSLKGLSDSLDYVEGYMREIEKYLGEHTEIYAMYKTKFARITVMEKRDVKGSMDKITQTFGSFVDDLLDFYQSILPSTMRFEELPKIEMTFGAGKKNMENLAKQFVNELISQTYNAWAVPILEEYNRLLGMDLFEKFGLPEIGELVGGIGHRWNEQMKKLYERLSREVLPSLGVAFTYAKTIMNLVDKYGEELVSVYKDEIANELVNMLGRYKGEVQGLKEEEVKKKAEEFGQTVNEYLSTVVSIIGEIEDVIAQYTLPSSVRDIRKLENWYQEMFARAEILNLSTERLNEALAVQFFKPLEDILDTRNDYEKALADLDAWYDAAVEFFNAHKEIFESLGYSIDIITQAYQVQRINIEESMKEAMEAIKQSRGDAERARARIEQELEQLIQQYTMSEPLWGLWKLVWGYREMYPRVTEVGASIEKLNEAYILMFFKPMQEMLEDTKGEFESQVQELIDWYNAMIGFTETFKTFFEENADILEKYGLSLDMIDEAFGKARKRLRESILSEIKQYTEPLVLSLEELSSWYEDLSTAIEILDLGLIDKLNEAMLTQFLGPLNEILKTEYDEFKAQVGNIDEWWDAALEFYETHKEAFESLGFSLDDLRDMYERARRKIFSDFLEPLNDLIRDINSTLKSMGIATPTLTIERFLSKWGSYMKMRPELLQSLTVAIQQVFPQVQDLTKTYAEFYGKNLPNLISDTKKYINLLQEQCEQEKKLYEQQIEHIREQIEYTEDLIQTWGNVADAVQDKINEIQLIALTPEQTWSQVQKQWQSLVQAFWAQPSAETAQALLDYSNQYLSAAEDMYKSSEKFLEIKQDVINLLTGVRQYAMSQQDALISQLLSLYSTEQDIRNILSQLDTNLTNQLNQVNTWLERVVALLSAPSIVTTQFGGFAEHVEEIGQTVEQAGDRIIKAIEATGVIIPEEQARLIHETETKGMYHLQKGGIVTSPTFAMLGESGPEAVIPLARNYSFHVKIDYDKLASTLAKKIESRPIRVEIDAPIKLDGREIKRWIWKSKMAREVI